jgi:hypothetical protein
MKGYRRPIGEWFADCFQKLFPPRDTSTLKKQADFAKEIINKADSSAFEGSSENFDNSIAAEIYKYTIVSFPFDNASSIPTTIPTNIPTCRPAPSWTKNLQSCYLLKLASKASTYPVRKVITVNTDGQLTDVVAVSQAPNGDYYYKDVANDFEYWKLRDTYLVGRVSGKKWLYWHYVMNKWCTFTPGVMQLLVKESVGSCANESTGSITLKVVGGTQPFLYSLNYADSIKTNTATYTYNNLSGGIENDFYVTDSLGCTATLHTQPLFGGNSVSLDARKRDCSNVVFLIAKCGTPPYQYSKDGVNYQSISFFTRLQADMGSKDSIDYKFYVKDNTGKRAYTKVTVKNMQFWKILTDEELYAYSPGPEPRASKKDREYYWYKFRPNVGNINSTWVSCKDGDDGTVNVRQSTVAEPPFIYGIDGTNISSSSKAYSFMKLSKGIHQIHIEDVNGCVANKEILVEEQQTLTIKTQIKAFRCNTDSTEVVIDIRGGTPFYNQTKIGKVYEGYFVFIDGKRLVPTVQIGDQYRYSRYYYSKFLKAGTHFILVKDDKGCSATDSINIPNPSPPLTATFNQFDIPCTGPEAAGSIEISPVGGKPPYQYELSGNRNTIFKTEPFFDNLTAGTYFVKVTDKNNCIVGLSATIKNLIPAIKLSTTPSACQASGTITITATGGTPSYEYSIDGGNNYQASNVFDTLAKGNYDVVVKDSKGCLGSATATVGFKDDNEVERSFYEPSIPNARTNGETITVRFNDLSTVYAFVPKAGVTIKRIANGKVELSTTNPEDKQWEGTYGVYFLKNDHNTFVGFYNETVSGPCLPSGYTINCNTLCKERWLPQEVYDGSFEPYIIAQSRHRKGLNEEGTAPHHDMMSCDMTDEQILTLNSLCSLELSRSEDDLVADWRAMAALQSSGKLQDNIMVMIDKFVRSEGGEYSNSDLTEAGKNHESTHRFISNIKASLEYELKKNIGFLNNKGLLKYIIDGQEQERKDIPSPTWGDYTTGLGIAVNDTWGYDVKILSFILNKSAKTYEAKLDIEIFDHFGLNNLDIDPNVKPLFSKLSGFRSWFVLQHSTRYCKKPFITIVKFNQTINGNY